jgi:hypothetical protein
LTLFASHPTTGTRCARAGDITRPTTRSKFRSAQSSGPAMTQSRPEPHSCSGRGCESASAISISVANLVHCRAKSRYAALAHGLVAAAANSAQRRAHARQSSGSPGMAVPPHRRVSAAPGCYNRLPRKEIIEKSCIRRAASTPTSVAGVSAPVDAGGGCLQRGCLQ